VAIRSFVCEANNSYAIHERSVQARSRIAPAGELLIHLIEEFFVHPSIIE
jgi:hypothetical protein